MKSLLIKSSLLLLSLMLFLPDTKSSDTIVKIHYLGHSSFVLQFDNGITVLTDYGKLNAWAPGWDSPIYSIGNTVPDVITYSHHDEDHYDPTRVPAGVSHILTGLDSLIIEGIEIKPIRTCEHSISTKDNSSYLFKYKGFKILHLGDAQAQIQNINNTTVRNQILANFPDTFDLLFMTIEGTSQFVAQAATFVGLLKPKSVIPMHFWTETNRNNFLNYLTAQNDSGKKYQVVRSVGSNYYFTDTIINDTTMVYSLQREALPNIPSEIFEIKSSADEKEIRLFQNSPNPFKHSTAITYTLPSRLKINLQILNMNGQIITSLYNSFQNEGIHSITWNGLDKNGTVVPSGIYFCKIYSPQIHNQTIMLVVK
jgi:L-ascorbate metabolism protein UlaG (beta-lactamase superfamily)